MFCKKTRMFVMLILWSVLTSTPVKLDEIGKLNLGPFRKLMMSMFTTSTNVAFTKRVDQIWPTTLMTGSYKVTVSYCFLFACSCACDAAAASGACQNNYDQ